MKFWYKEIPSLNELVLVKFDKKHDIFFSGNLIEYEHPCYLNFCDATKKKKVYSWNKILQLEKYMVAKVIHVDTDLINVSLLYLNEYINDIYIKKNFEIQKKLLISFEENERLIKFIKSFCIINKYNFENVWKNLFYYIEKIKINENFNNSLFVFFSNNLNTNLNKWILDCGYNDYFYDELLKFYNKKFEIKKKIISNFALISLNNIENTKNIIKNNIKDYDIKIFYLSGSTYSIESYDEKYIELFYNNIKNNISPPNELFFLL